MFRRLFTIMLVPKDRSEVKSINVSPALLYLSILIFLLWVGATVFYVKGYYSKAHNESELVRLRAENETLVNRVELMGSEVDGLEQKMRGLMDHENKLRILAELPEIDEDIRKVGIGGPSFGLFEGDSGLSIRSASLTRGLQMDIDQLTREAKLVRASLKEIEEKFRRRKHVLDHTPTIRPTNGIITSGFGRRRNPFTGRIEFHRAVDIANRKGTPIYAPADGLVKYFGYINRYYGNLLIISHGYGVTTYYAHLHRSFVRPRERVNRGQKIATMGGSGRATNSHLHYEVRLNNRPVNPFNYFYANEMF